MKMKLYRDKVISIIKGRDLVGVYVKIKKERPAPYKGLVDIYEEEMLLAEMSPAKADKIIKIWNGR